MYHSIKNNQRILKKSNNRVKEKKLKVMLPLYPQDPTLETPMSKGVGPITFLAKEEFFLDGPISKNIAVLDFCPLSGILMQGRKLRKFAEKYAYDFSFNYQFSPTSDVVNFGFMQLNVFALVLHAIHF